MLHDQRTHEQLASAARAAVRRMTPAERASARERMVQIASADEKQRRGYGNAIRLYASAVVEALGEAGQ